MNSSLKDPNYWFSLSHSQSTEDVEALIDFVSHIYDEEKYGTVEDYFPLLMLLITHPNRRLKLLAIETLAMEEYEGLKKPLYELMVTEEDMELKTDYLVYYFSAFDKGSRDIELVDLLLNYALDKTLTDTFRVHSIKSIFHVWNQTSIVSHKFKWLWKMIEDVNNGEHFEEIMDWCKLQPIVLDVRANLYEQHKTLFTEC